MERKCFQETDVTTHLNISVKSHSGQDMLTIRKVHTWEGGWFPHSPWTSGILNLESSYSSAWLIFLLNLTFSFACLHFSSSCYSLSVPWTMPARMGGGIDLLALMLTMCLSVCMFKQKQSKASFFSIPIFYTGVHYSRLPYMRTEFFRDYGRVDKDSVT